MKTFYKILTVLVLFLASSITAAQAQKKFTVVIDAGHGGHTRAVVNFREKKHQLSRGSQTW